MAWHCRIGYRHGDIVCVFWDMGVQKTQKIYPIRTVLFDGWIFIFDYNHVFDIITDKGKMERKSLIFLTFIIGVIFTPLVAFSSSLFSNYGQIQNVQNYSTNPFWTPNSPYNKKLPQPVYVQGAELTAEDCTNVVQSLVSVQCMVRDNCKNTQLSDVRPAIMVQLAGLPNHNYVSACAGFIDDIYEKYVAYYGNNAPTNKVVAFPTATVPNPDVQSADIQIQNPYKQQIPQWQQEMNERAEELQQLQELNAAQN